MDGENNRKPYFLMGWFGGTIIFGNTQMLTIRRMHILQY